MKRRTDIDLQEVLDREYSLAQIIREYEFIEQEERDSRIKDRLRKLNPERN